MKFFEYHGYKISYAGLGTTQFWTGGSKEAREVLVKAVREYGVNLIDTAEMYGGGMCEKVLGRLLKETGRDNVYLVDKILPENMREDRFRKSLEKSLELLGTDHIDLFLLHWREDADLRLLVQEMEQAKKEGKILEWGVSNFDTDDLKDLLAVPQGDRCFCNQIYCSVFERGCETQLLPYMREHGIFPMAYSALGSGSFTSRELRHNEHIFSLCSRYGVTPESLMLAKVNELGFAALFSTSSSAHLDANLQEIPESCQAELLQALDEEYPAPSEIYPLVKI